MHVPHKKLSKFDPSGTVGGDHPKRSRSTSEEGGQGLEVPRKQNHLNPRENSRKERIRKRTKQP